MEIPNVPPLIENLLYPLFKPKIESDCKFIGCSSCIYWLFRNKIQKPKFCPECYNEI
jgi:hypothetical protein